MPRAEERSEFDSIVRLRLIEGDMDRAETRFETLETRLTHRLEAVDARLGKIMWALVGVLISVTTTCIVLVVTLGVS